MNGLLLLVISAAVLAGAYLLYGRFLARVWGIDPFRKTPAHELEDGMEYVPTSPAVVFGHEFASIAGAGPINGPIIAAMFGWFPALLWLLFGSVFFGAVHDFAALYTSVKNKGKSAGYVIEHYVGKAGKRLFLIFVWLFSVLIAAAFADIAAGTFAGFEGLGVPNPTNASVASTSCLFIAAAILLGFLIRKRKASDLASAIVAVDLLIVCIVLGIFFPVYFTKTVWLYLIFGYIFIASVAPVWALGQPRNYLNSFLLIAMVLAAFIGVVFTAPPIAIPAFTSFKVGGNFLFPGLFITIACGAISGFHSLVATGATSKQISNERHMLPISYGAMLVETLVAVLALISVGSLARDGALPQGTPPFIFATAVSGFLHQLGLPDQVSFIIVSLAVSSFVLTTLDTVARLGRLAFQELFSPPTGAPEGGFNGGGANTNTGHPFGGRGAVGDGGGASSPEGAPEGGFNGGGVTTGCGGPFGGRGIAEGGGPGKASSPEGVTGIADTSQPIKTPFWGSKPAASLLTLFPAYLLAIMGYQNIWALFGAANQLLAALTLIACTLFFQKTGRRIFMLIVPTVIMLAVTYSSLVLTIRSKVLLFLQGNFNPAVDGLQMAIAVLLLVLGVLVAVSCAAKLREQKPAPGA